MIFTFTRARSIWIGVGLSHLAALGYLWAPSALAEVSGDGVILVTLLSAETGPALVPRDVVAPPLPSPHLLPPLKSQLGPAALAVPPTPSASPAPTSSVSLTPARFIRRVEPAYPRPARLAGEEGAVRLRLRLTAQGELAAVDILESSGSPALDAAALAAAQASAFAPAESAGKPVTSETEATYRFKLR